MRILFLTHTFPYPLDDGIKLYAYHLLKHLSPTNKIFLLSLTNHKVTKEAQAEIKKLGIEIVGIIEHKIPKSFLARIVNCLFDPIPFFTRQFESNNFRETLYGFLAKEKIDVIHADYLSMAIYQDIFKNVPALAFPYDAMSMLFRRNAKQEKNFLRRIYLLIQAKKTSCFESQWLPKFDAVAVVSEIDKAYLLKQNPNLKIVAVINGVDTEYFKPIPELEAIEPTVVFRGNMNFFPNHDAALFFYKEILPLIRQKLPKTRFVVAGKRPHPNWKYYQSQDPLLTITGYVDDIRPYMAQAQVVVCPMRSASGIQNKVLESMAMTKAIVATHLACEGLSVQNEKHLFLADNESVFAEKTLRLLAGKILREDMGKAARDFVIKNHTWKNNAIAFERLYATALTALKT